MAEQHDHCGGGGHGDHSDHVAQYRDYWLMLALAIPTVGASRCSR